MFITGHRHSQGTGTNDSTVKKTEQNLIARNGKSEVKVTNNKTLRSRYCTAKEWQEASCCFSVTAELLDFCCDVKTFVFTL